MTARPRERSAFTLIELLVVIAIIAILAAILFPVFAQAREKGRQAACMSNEKQITLGVLQYIQDNDEAFPLSVVSRSATPPTGAIIGWADAIQPYVKSIAVYQCPSEPAASNPDPTKAGYTDYYINKNASDGTQTLPKADHPTLTILIGECGPNGAASATTALPNSTARFRSNGCNGAGDTTTLDPTLPACDASLANKLASNLTFGGQRHLLGANFGFVDGHVKWVKNPGVNTTNTIWNGITMFSVSGENPTFRLSDKLPSGL